MPSVHNGEVRRELCAKFCGSGLHRAVELKVLMVSEAQL